MATNPDALGIPFGKFHLLDRLGRGGMAEVWKAKALGPMGYARKLVVKRVLPELLADEDFVRMFVEEARLSASLNHRNIVQVYEFGDVGGEYYLAMEWVHGRDLNTLLRGLREKSEAPPVGLATYVGREVCRALGYAHALTDEDGTPLRLIHRDVSPSNVMVGFDGSVKLLDFGIAKAMAVASENRTQAGVLKGKFGYMSPEQIEGDVEIDHRADLFVAGVLLWEMLTLTRLFKGASDVQTLSMVRAAKVVPPSTLNPAVPPELDAICMRALARSRNDRFADCDEMAAALDEVVHTLKFGSEHTARMVRRLFPNVAEPTQQLALVPVPDRTPSNPPSNPPSSPPSATPTPKGQRIDNAPTRLIDVQPSAPTALRRVVSRLTAPTLQRERRVIVATAALVALAGIVMGTRRPATPAPQVVAPQVVAPLAGAPWLTTVSAAAETPTPRPATPATVTIKLTTRPPGATVTVEGEAAARGVTPLALSLPRGDSVRRLVLSAPGHVRALAEVTPDVDSRLHFELERTTTKVRRHAIARHIQPVMPPVEEEKPVIAPLSFRGIRAGE